MDWKPFYRHDLTSLPAKEATRKAFAAILPRDPVLDDAFARGGVISFPHTLLASSAPSLARVVEAIYRRGTERVVALGVLHGGVLDSPHRERFTAYREDDLRPVLTESERREIFAQYGGAFLGLEALVTPLGTLESFYPETPLRRDEELLRHEFSLDTFLALLAGRGAELGQKPPRVLPLYVGQVRGPKGDLDTAAALAVWIRAQAADDLVVVATGDVVHYGHGYSTPEDMAGKPMEPHELREIFRVEIERSFDMLLGKAETAAFFRHGVGTLRSDQVNVLPVIAAYVGPRGHAHIVDLEWADYARVLAQPPPCLVASALTVFLPWADLIPGR